VLVRLQRACGGRGRALLLAALIGLGLGLRLDHAIRAPNEPVDDARTYARIARSLYAGDGFSQGADPRYRYLQPASNYTPGLPLLVAGVYEVRGDADLRAARIFLAVLATLAVPLAFLLGSRLAGPDAGLIAALPMAIYPALLDYTGMLMTEPLATALLGGLLLAFLAACDDRRLRWWAAAGLLLGALAMLRPEYLVLLAVLPLVAVVRLRRRAGNGIARFAPAAVLAGCTVLVIVPWTVRNLIELERLVPLSTGGGQLLYQGSYIPAGPDPENITPTILERNPWIRRKLAPLPGPIYRGQVVAELAARRHPGENTDTALTRMGIDAYADALTGQPLDLASFLARKVWFALTDPGRTVMRHAVWRAFQIALLLAALAGLAIGVARRSFDVWAIAAVVLAITALQAIFIASPRRTLVLLPLLGALAGAGLVWLAERLRART
jgi:hypothetical protein